MKRLTIAAAPAGASSSTYAMRVTAGQEGPVASVSFCNLGYTQTVGFWSLAGDGFVPTLLQVDRNSEDPTAVDLSWSGSAATFAVYRALDPTSIDDAGNVIAITPTCAATDAPPSVSIVFYLVEPSGN